MWDRTKAADGRLSNCGMNIGDLVLHEGRRYYLRGLDPMSTPDRQAFLEDARARRAYGVPSGVNNILIINKVITADRVTAIIVGERLGF